VSLKGSGYSIRFLSEHRQLLDVVVEANAGGLGSYDGTRATMMSQRRHTRISTHCTVVDITAFWFIDSKLVLAQ
jgi:hypothetical protein